MLRELDVNMEPVTEPEAAALKVKVVPVTVEPVATRLPVAPTFIGKLPVTAEPDKSKALFKVTAHVTVTV
jgi:hypothetical protein